MPSLILASFYRDGRDDPCFCNTIIQRRSANARNLYLNRQKNINILIACQEFASCAAENPVDERQEFRARAGGIDLAAERGAARKAPAVLREVLSQLDERARALVRLQPRELTAHGRPFLLRGRREKRLPFEIRPDL